MLENLKQTWTDFRYSSFFWPVVGVVVLGSVAFGLFILTALQPKSAVAPVVQKPAKVSLTKNFDSASNLERVSQTEVNPYFFGFTSEGKPIYTNKDFKITVADSVFQSNTSYLPSSYFYIEPNKILINQDRTSSILDLSTGNSEALAESIYGVTQVAPDRYLFIQKRDNGIAIKEAKDLNFSDVQTLGTQDFTLFTPDNLEIRAFNNKPYLISTSVSDQGSKLTIYSIEGDKLIKKSEIDNVYAKTFGFDKLFVTRYQANLVSNEIVTFSSSDKLETKAINVSRDLSQSQIFGTILANRCAFSNGENKVVCVIKTQPGVNSENPLEPDSIVEINLDEDSFVNLLPNVPISVNTIYQSDQNEIYIVGQENNLVYRLKK